ncbi:MAG TPA: hypothetical protein PLU87_08610 [Sedimentisphaerales bacterium]|nr:hypothetical protein [Sedimentisphaerales bacterium]HRS10778.1 hypothetical protein [Sedimentisphaerales bacterium]HRV47483.1 hypothetical protein [Sedimentisphaerales bacterium]
MTCDGNTPRLPDPKEQPVQWLHQFAEALDDIAVRADKVHELVLDDSVLERFRQADRLFYEKLKAWWKANNAYEAALEPFVEKVYDCDSELRRCAAQMARLHKQGLHTSPEYQHLEEDKRGWIKKKAKADKELEKAKAKAELQAPGPCPTTWLELPPHSRMAPNKRDLMEHMFPDDGPAMTEEAARLRAYVLLTILHDHALKGGVVPIAGNDIWPRDDEDVPGDFAGIQWKSMQSDPYAWYPALDVALATVEKDLSNKPPMGATAALIYEKLLQLPKHRGMDTTALLNWLSDAQAANAEGRDLVFIDEGTLRGHLKQIKPYGLKNAPRIGYYIR